MPDCLLPHGLQPARLPCPSLSPRVCSNSCPLSQWCHQPPHHLSPTSPPALNLSQHQVTFPISWLFTSGCQGIEASASVSASVLPMNIQDWFPLGLTDPLAVQGTQESSPAPQFKSINSLVLSFLYGPTLTSIYDYWKNHNFEYTDLCRQSGIFAF